MAQKRTVLQIRINESDKHLIESAALTLDMSISDFARQILTLQSRAVLARASQDKIKFGAIAETTSAFVEARFAVKEIST